MTVSILASSLQRVSRSSFFSLDRQCLSDVLSTPVHNSDPRSVLVFEQRWNFNTNVVSSYRFANLFSMTKAESFIASDPPFVHNLPFHFEVMRVLGIKIESSVHQVMEVHSRIVRMQLLRGEVV